MSDFSAHVTGLEPFFRKFQQAPAIVTDELAKAGRRSGLAVEAGAKKAVRVWRGHLQRSITSTQAPFGTTVQPLFTTTRIGTAVPYGIVMDQGRRAGAPPPPTSAIREYLRSKGEDPRLAYVVARAIGRNGIRGDGFLTKTFERLKPDIRREFAQVPKRVIARLQGGA